MRWVLDARVIGFAGAVVGSVAVVNQFGIIPVGFGFEAPSSAYLVGAAFALKGAAKHCVGLGRFAVVASLAIAVAASLSPHYALAKGVGLASAVVVGLTVEGWLARRGRHGAAFLGSTVAANVIESVAFLLIAYGSLGALVGLLFVRAYLTAGVIGAQAVYRRRAAAVVPA